MVEVHVGDTVQLIGRWEPSTYYASVQGSSAATKMLGGFYTVTYVTDFGGLTYVKLAKDGYGYLWPETAIASVFHSEGPESHPEIQSFGGVTVREMLEGVVSRR